MRALDSPLLADENIHPKVIAALSARGLAVTSVAEVGLQGRSDREILAFSHARQWVVLTHDRDFGLLSIRERQPYFGIVYLRPGHIDPEFVIEMVEFLVAKDLEVLPPFLLVAERHDGALRVRIRSGA